MKNKTIIFFRNDDVRGTLDKSLTEMTEIFINHHIPLIHAVEPANVSSEVADYLLLKIADYPGIVELMQHGYDHSIKNNERKGEFGGQRGYDEQFKEIKAGKDLMDKNFGKNWFPAFNFPFGPYNLAAMQAVADTGIKMVNGSSGIDFKRKLFYMTAHLLRKEMFLGYRVPYNLKRRPITKLFQVDMSVGFIDKYYDEESDCKMMTLDEMKNETMRFMHCKTIGVLMHHRYHNTAERIKLIEDYLVWLKTLPNIEFSNLEGIYNKYASK